MHKFYKKASALVLALTLAFQPCLIHAEEEPAIAITDETINEEITEITETTEITSQEAGPYSIHYDLNGGTSGPSDGVTDADGNYTISSEFPYRFGYDFRGWCETNTLYSWPFAPGTQRKYTGDEILVAQWDNPATAYPMVNNQDYLVGVIYHKNYYNFLFTPQTSGYYYINATNDQGVSFAKLYESNGQFVAEDTGTDERNNFEMIAYLDKNKSYVMELGFVSYPTSYAVDCHFKFEKANCIYYVLNGGSSGPEFETSRGETTTSNIIPERFGYNFLGWATSADAKTPQYYPGSKLSIGSDIVLYALWENAKGISVSGDYMSYNTGITIAGADKYYKITQSQDHRYNLYTEGSEDTIAFLYDENGNLLSSDDNSGDDNNFLFDYLFEANKSYYLKVGYTDKNATGSIKVYFSSCYLLTYDANGGNDAPESQIRPSSTSFYITDSVPTRTYKVTFKSQGGTSVKVRSIAATFDSWNTKADGTGASFQPGALYNFYSDKTLYAQWKPATYGYLPMPTRDGYTFEGWYTSATGGTAILPTSEIAGDMTLYAHWKTKSVLPTLPSIVRHPQRINAGVNSTVSFSVEAEGNNLTYQWQYSKNGGEKWIVSSATGCTTDSISLKVSTSNAGNIYRCKITDANGQVIYSDVAGVDLIPGVVITKNPQSQVAEVGEFAYFTVEAENAAGYQWQYSKDGAHWYNSGAQGNNTKDLMVKADQKSQGNRYRCVVLGTDGNKKKSLGCAMIVLQEAPKFSTAKVGETATFSLKAVGIAEYQWQYSKDQGQTWYKSGAAGNTTDSISFKVTSRNMWYRCKLTTEDGAYGYTAPVTFQ